MHMLILCLRYNQILFHVVMCINIQAVYTVQCTAIDTDQLTTRVDILLSVIKATATNINNVMSLDNYLVSGIGVAIHFIRLGS